MVARRFRNPWGFALPLAVAGWMCYENYDDHDRSGQHAASRFASAILESTEKDAVIFVNGDNYTFPLWYAQEVEGVRRDVRVVNLAYLNSAVYASSMMADWRDSRGLETTLKRPDILWEAFRSVSVGASRDTLDALLALKELRNSADVSFPARYVRLKISPDSTAVYDLRNLSAGRGRTADFGRLMMFDIVASNSGAGTPRPVYWLESVSADRRIGLDAMSSPWVFGYRFGKTTDSRVDSMMIEGAMRFRSPNSPGKDVYMDHAASVQVGVMRGALVKAARRLLENGDVANAVLLADRADILPGEGIDTYGSVPVGDTVMNVRKELGKLLIDCADSLALAREGSRARHDGVNVTTRAIELKARGNHHLSEYERLQTAWREYRKSLPPRLRNKMSPAY